MKPWIHSQNSVKRWGGKPEDYLLIHNWFDISKSAFPDMRHRAIRHHSLGCYEAEAFFGTNLVNSDGKLVSVRDVAEFHVIEDCSFIPTLSDYLNEMPFYDWLGGKKKSKKVIKDFLNISKEVEQEVKESNNFINNKPLVEIYLDQRNNEFSTTRTALEELRDSFGIKPEDLKKFAKLNNPEDGTDFRDRMVD